MSAERLREAAEVLRITAEAATPGPWTAEREPTIGYIVATHIDWVCTLGDQEGQEEDATYITTMSPPVALALADWLAEEVARSTERSPYFFPVPALEIADAILGTRS